MTTEVSIPLLPLFHNKKLEYSQSSFSYMLRNSVGVQFLMILNILIKEDRLEKPELIATSVTVYSGLASSFSAVAIRF